MPSPERPGSYHKEQEPLPPYYKAARFSGEQPAGQAYFQAQEAIFKNEDNDLSAYRLQLNQIWHVVALGEPPPEDLGQEIEKILSSGEATSLPDDVLKLLQVRRNQATNRALWVERHYRPGKRL